MLSYNNVGWTDQNLAGVSPNQGSPPIHDAERQQHVFYLGGFPSTHVHQLFYNGNDWADEDLTVETGALPLAEERLRAFPYKTTAMFTTTDYASSHLHQMLYNNIDWTDIDLTAITGGPAAWAGSVVASRQPGIAHLYMDMANPAHSPDIQYQRHELAGSGFDRHHRRTLGSFAHEGMAGFNIGNYSYLYFVSQADGHVHQFLYNNSNWSDEDLTALTKSSPSQSESHSVAALVIPGTKKLRVYLQAANDHICSWPQPTT